MPTYIDIEYVRLLLRHDPFFAEDAPSIARFASLKSDYKRATQNEDAQAIRAHNDCLAELLEAGVKDEDIRSRFVVTSNT